MSRTLINVAVSVHFSRKLLKEPEWQSTKLEEWQNYFFAHFDCTVFFSRFGTLETGIAIRSLVNVVTAKRPRCRSIANKCLEYKLFMTKGIEGTVRPHGRK